MAILIRCNVSNINKKIVGWIVRNASLFFFLVCLQIFLLICVFILTLLHIIHFFLILCLISVFLLLTNMPFAVGLHGLGFTPVTSWELNQDGASTGAFHRVLLGDIYMCTTCCNINETLCFCHIVCLCVPYGSHKCRWYQYTASFDQTSLWTVSLFSDG